MFKSVVEISKCLCFRFSTSLPLNMKKHLFKRHIIVKNTRQASSHRGTTLRFLPSQTYENSTGAKNARQQETHRAELMLLDAGSLILMSSNQERYWSMGGIKAANTGSHADAWAGPYPGAARRPWHKSSQKDLARAEGYFFQLPAASPNRHQKNAPPFRQWQRALSSRRWHDLTEPSNL